MTTQQTEIQHFGGRIGPRLKLIKAIPVEVSRDNGLVTVWSPDVEEFGSGKSLSEAMDDFGASLAGLWEILHKYPLGDHLKSVLARMHDFMQVKQ